MDPVWRRGALEAARLATASRVAEAAALVKRTLQDGPPLTGSGQLPGSSATSLPQALRGLLDRVGLGELPLPGTSTAKSKPAATDNGEFLAKSFSNQAGTRPYKLYIPGGYRGEPLPLIVMLHGCTQSPDDFATGTRMNAAAEAERCFVVYPGQTSTANHSKCWNWFSPDDQRRDLGEPSLIAGITRQVMQDYAIDPARVYIAGLSAGGAAAATIGSIYPDLYAAIGVHSGLACGAAHDMTSAFMAMRNGGGGRMRTGGATETARVDGHGVPTIVFHGDRDTTVNPANGDDVVAQLTQSQATRPEKLVEKGSVPGGHTYTRTQFRETNGRVICEQWVVHGASHSWSGGSPAGSYTDASGPDATREMLRFFLEHPRRNAIGAARGG